MKEACSRCSFTYEGHGLLLILSSSKSTINIHNSPYDLHYCLLKSHDEFCEEQTHIDVFIKSAWSGNPPDLYSKCIYIFFCCELMFNQIFSLVMYAGFLQSFSLLSPAPAASRHVKILIDESLPEDEDINVHWPENHFFSVIIISAVMSCLFSVGCLEMEKWITLLIKQVCKKFWNRLCFRFDLFGQCTPSLNHLQSTKKTRRSLQWKLTQKGQVRNIETDWNVTLEHKAV